jgi:hypothetical protein
MGQLGGLIGEFKKNCRLGIGICDAPAFITFGRSHHILGCAAGSQYYAFTIGRHLGNIGILAKAAFKVAADSGNGIRRCPGKEMKQGFFFNRIDVLGDEITIDQGIQNTGVVFTHIANPSAAVFDDTTMAAQVAPYLFFLQPFIEVRFHVSYRQINGFVLLFYFHA